MDRVVDELRFQAEACGDLGSPLYRDMMRQAADEATGGGIVAGLLGPYADAPRGSAMVLRLFGTVHGLALAGQAPELPIALHEIGANAGLNLRPTSSSSAPRTGTTGPRARRWCSPARGRATCHPARRCTWWRGGGATSPRWTPPPPTGRCGGRPTCGRTRPIVWHSVMWQYLDAHERAAAGAELARLPEHATASGSA